MLVVGVVLTLGSRRLLHNERPIGIHSLARNDRPETRRSSGRFEG